MSRDELTRRELLERVAAALASGGLAACTRAPAERVVPYVVQPPEVTPGRARRYASASVLDGYATGILVESHEGRPTKIEGNPDHPASLGATSAFDQASVLSLYDPCRARGVKHRGAPSSWVDALSALSRGRWHEERGRGLYVLLAPSSSPTLADLLAATRARWPEAAISLRARDLERRAHRARASAGRSGAGRGHPRALPRMGPGRGGEARARPRHERE